MRRAEPLRPKAGAVANARNSICDSARLVDLDWTNWWTDSAHGHNYLHVMHKDGQTSHRVRCKLLQCNSPRLTMRAGVLHWLVDASQVAPTAPPAPAIPGAPRGEGSAQGPVRRAQRRTVVGLALGTAVTKLSLETSPQWELLAIVLKMRSWQRVRLAEELGVSTHTLNKWMETQGSKNFRRMRSIYRERLIELASQGDGQLAP